MTDKEQIIDFKCTENCYKKNTSECYGLECIEGQHNVLKQLACKTQECEELKEDYKELEQRHNGAFQDFERLKQEYKDLKERLAVANFEIESLRDLQEPYAQYVARYRKALEEIEGVAKEMHSICFKEISIAASQLNDRIYRESCERFKQILDIINNAREK